MASQQKGQRGQKKGQSVLAETTVEPANKKRQKELLQPHASSNTTASGNTTVNVAPATDRRARNDYRQVGDRTSEHSYTRAPKNNIHKIQ